MKTRSVLKWCALCFFAGMGSGQVIVPMVINYAVELLRHLR